MYSRFKLPASSRGILYIYKCFNLKGNLQTLDEVGCVLGDQLTRVRMEGVKDFSSLSRTKKARLEHLQFIVCELWHLKADFQETDI